MKKKILCLLSILTIIVFSLTACNADKGDWTYIEEQGKMVIGYTLFEPMNYKENGELVGFDTELAEAVCEKLGVKPEFVEINWETKETELNSKAIDAIWNGFTINETRKQQLDFTIPYLINKQVAVVKKDRLAEFGTIDALAAGSLAAEKKSAGETAIQTDDKLKTATYAAMELQTDALLEVKAGTSDACVIDYTMAKAMLAENSDYSDLAIVEGVSLLPEEYGIGFRKNSTQTIEKVNAALKELGKSGKIAEIAAKYNLTDELAEELN